MTEKNDTIIYKMTKQYKNIHKLTINILRKTAATRIRRKKLEASARFCAPRAVSSTMTVLVAGKLGPEQRFGGTFCAQKSCFCPLWVAAGDHHGHQNSRKSSPKQENQRFLVVFCTIMVRLPVILVTGANFFAKKRCADTNMVRESPQNAMQSPQVVP